MDDAGFATDHGAVRATWATSSPWVPMQIPPRPWIAKGYLLRRAITVLIGAGGVSKSTLMLAYAVALALGVDYHGLRPMGRYKVALYNVEDDDDEQQRRLSAVLTSLGHEPRAIADKVLRIGPTKVGTLLARDPDTKELYRTEAMMELVANVRAFGADVLMVDPLAELHGDDENDNNALRQVVAEFRALAVELDMSIVLVHHTRKGIVTPGDMDAGRGASSIASAARVVLTVVGMTEDDARALGLPPGSHKHFFRVDGGKANYSALTDCEWFERQPYDLGQGDHVAVPLPWHPPVDAVTPEKQVQVEAAIRRGSPQGPYSPQLGNTPRSVKHALVEAGITTAAGQKDMLAAIFKGGFVTLRFRDPRRKYVNGIRSADGMPSNVEWEDEGSTS